MLFLLYPDPYVHKENESLDSATCESGSWLLQQLFLFSLSWPRARCIIAKGEGTARLYYCIYIYNVMIISLAITMLWASVGYLSSLMWCIPGLLDIYSCHVSLHVFTRQVPGYMVTYASCIILSILHTLKTLYVIQCSIFSYNDIQL